MWMLMEGAVLYLALVVIFTSSNIKYMFLFALASYGECSCTSHAVHYRFTVPLNQQSVEYKLITLRNL